MMKKTFAVVSLAALAACTAAPKKASADPRSPRPDWVDNHSTEYPRDRYVTGVGAGDDRSTAEDRARGEISKVFSTNVTVDTTQTESETNTNGQGVPVNVFSQNIAQSVHSISKKVLEDVNLVDYWQDNATRVHYALAALDRAKAKAAVTDKLGELDQQAKQWKAQMDSAPDKLGKAKAAMKLLTVLRARAELNGELRVLDESGRGLPGSVDEAAIKPAAAKAVGALDVLVDMTGSGSDEVETAIVRGLNTFGLQASVGSAGEHDIAVSGKMDTKEVQQGDETRWKWARSTVTVSLKDGRTGKIFARFDASDREASANYEEAARRTRVELAKKVSEKINEAVTAYFENN